MQSAAIRLVLTTMLAASSEAQAQPAPIAPAASSSSQSPTPSERAQRDADKVFQMILQHADKPRRAAGSPEQRAPAPPAVPRAGTSPTAASASAPTPARVANGRVNAPTVPALPGEPTKPARADADAETAAVIGPTAPAAAGLAEAVAPVVALVPVVAITPRSLKLELVSSVQPEFPARLVRSLGKGSVVVNFEVRPDGSVARTEVASSSHRGLNEAAQAAVSAWRFKPISESLPGSVELKFE